MQRTIYTIFACSLIVFSSLLYAESCQSLLANAQEIGSCSLLPPASYCVADCPEKVIKKYKQSYKPLCFCCPRKTANLGYYVGRDFISLFAHLWDWDTLKVLVGIFPLFIGSRMIDEPMQNNFFCHHCHCNMNQLPRWCYDSVQWGISVPVIILGLTAFLARDFELRYAGWMLLLSWPLLIFGKDIIKNFEGGDFCLRPWHEDFCKEEHKRFGGGFPSGHMAEATFLAVLYGSRYGPKAALPLGLLATWVGAVFLSCNRHYLSQLVAGVGLGTIVAIAANKVIDHRISEKLALGISCDSRGNPGFSVSWQF